MGLERVTEVMEEIIITQLSRSLILAFANVITILGYTQGKVIEIIKKQIQAGEKSVSEVKTKYMIFSREKNILGGIINNIKVRQYKFERVVSFKYLRTLMNSKNGMH